MATLNVGAMAARLGLDPAEFLDKMKGVEGFTSGLNQRMAAETKKTAREGAESFRLIDEALGIHIARPITKILTREFPAFASALQSVMGVGLVGALAAVGVGIAEHISKKMEEAKRKTEEYADAVRKVQTVIAEAGVESERRLNETLGKDAGVRGDTAAEAYYKGLATDAANVERLAKFTDQLAESLRKEAAAAAAQMPVWAALGKIWHEITSSQGTAQTEKINDQIKVFQNKFADLSRQDALHHTTAAAVFLVAELTAAQTKLETMEKIAAAPPKRMVVAGGFVADAPGTISPQAVEAQRKYLDGIKEVQTEQGRVASVAQAEKQLERDTEAKKMAEEITKALEKLRGEQKRMLEESNRFGKELHNALNKKDEVELLDEAFKNTMATLAQYRALVGGKAFFAEFGVSADELGHKLAGVTAHLESEAQLKKFLEQSHEGPKREFGDTATPFPLEIPAMPTLTHGGAVAGEMAAFQEEPRKQIEMMKKAFEEAMTPVEKFNLAQRELDLILRNADGTFRAGAEGAAAYAGAMRHLVEEEEKHQAASRSATDGLHAFWLEMQHGAEANGAFAFRLSTTFFKDFEDGMAKNILATARQHHEMKVMWQNYFRGLEEMALKFSLNKSMTGILGQLAKTPLGQKIGGMLGHAGAGKDAATVANTTATVANTAAINALTAKSTIASGGGGAGGLLGLIPGLGGGGGAGAGVGGGDVGGFSGFFAEGGDPTPGSSFVSGEAGLERVDLTRGGGAHVTPLSTKSSGEVHNHYHMEGSIVTDDLLRKAEGAQMMRASEQRAVATTMSMQSELGKRSRPSR